MSGQEWLTDTPLLAWPLDFTSSPVSTGIMLPAPKQKTKVSLNARTGLLEVYDVETGKLMAVQESPSALLHSEYHERLVERLLPDGSVVKVEASIDPVRLMDFRFEEYSSYVVDLICEKLATGGSLTKICKMPGFPTYSVLCRWKRQDPSVQERLDEARRDRAEAMRDALYDEALSVEESSVDSTKVRIDAYKYLAGTDDKVKYGGSKGGVEVGATAIQIVVNTGIVRTPKVGEN